MAASMILRYFESKSLQIAVQVILRTREANVIICLFNNRGGQHVLFNTSNDQRETNKIS